MRIGMGDRLGPSPREIVRVALGERSYEILVGRGVSGEAPQRAASLGARAIALVSDANVAALHADALAGAFDRAGLRTVGIAVPPGEASKSVAVWQEVCGGILDGRIERGDLVVALGGGVVGDLAGFAAASVRRGIRLLQIPTSLLAQVDSSVGGKTGINAPQGKNLIGAFHQPALVLCDTAFLDTLPPRELKAGYAEVVKYGLIGDPSFFRWCEQNVAAVMAGGPERDRAVAQSCRAKAATVAKDEREEGERALLNLGHTFAHALERAVGYDGARLVHGEAVAIGLALAFRFSTRLGLCPPEDSARVAAHLSGAGLPTRIAEVPGDVGTPDDLVAAMGQDKKVRHGELTFILARGIGRSFVVPGISAGDVGAFLRAEMA